MGELVVGVAAVVVTGVVAFSAIAAQRWKRHVYALDLSRQWDLQTLVARSQILRHWPIYDSAFPKAIPLVEIRERHQQQVEEAAANPALHQVYITEHFTSLLNFMNTVCMAVDIKAASEPMIRRDLGQPFMRWTEALEEFLHDFQSKRMRPENPWPSLGICLVRWYGGRAAQIVKAFPREL